MSSRAAGAGWRGCLEIAGLVVFGLVLGAFAMSTWVQHRGGAGRGAGETPGARDAAEPAVDRSRIRVEVQNGSGLEGAAGRMTEYLRAAGFDVVEFGNADRFDHERTRVRGAAGDSLLARDVAAALRDAPVEPADSMPPSVDVVVVVGRDMEEVLAADEEAPRRSGWRGWLDRLRGR